MLLGLDPLYWLFVGPTMLLAVFAQMRVKGAYSKWSNVGASSRMSGAQAGMTRCLIGPPQGS